MADDNVETIMQPARPFTGPDFIDVRFMLFIAALIAYGIGSSPTPDVIGGAEIFTGLALILAAGVWRSAHVIVSIPRAGWARAAQILLFYGLSVPVLIGVVAGNASGTIVRDMIAFMFLLLPLFMHDLCARKAHYRRPLTVAVVIVGLLFSLRVLAPVFAHATGPVWYIQPPADPFYLANAPTVLFAALFLGGLAGKELYSGNNARNGVRIVVFSVLAFLPLAAMALITQRASIGIVVLSACLLCAIGFWRRPHRMVMPVLALLLVVWVGWDIVHFIGQEAARKTAIVGLNMRWAEAMAVAHELVASPLTVIFGKGWGATIASPAVGGVTVNFTHSLITTYWLKTGMVGLFLALVYLFHIANILLRLLFARPVLALALAGPLAIDVLLYASFKSLDFGLILLLVTIYLSRPVLVASPTRPM